MNETISRFLGIKTTEDVILEIKKNLYKQTEMTVRTMNTRNKLLEKTVAYHIAKATGKRSAKSGK